MGDETSKEQTAGAEAEEEAAQADTTETQASEPEPAEEAEMMARLQEEIRNLPVSEHLLYMMHSLSALAVGRMGVTPETTTLRDLEQARMAIDAFKALMDIVERSRPAKEMAAHRGVLSQLQLAYVGAMDAGTSGAGETAEDAPPSGPDAPEEKGEADSGTEEPVE